MKSAILTATVWSSLIIFYLFRKNLVFSFVLALPKIPGTPKFRQIHFLFWPQTCSRPEHLKNVYPLLHMSQYCLNRLRTGVLLKTLTQFFPELLVFVHKVIDSQLELVDLFGHGLCLTISHSNLIVTLFDLGDGCFQTISALPYRNSSVACFPSKSLSCLTFPYFLFFLSCMLLCVCVWV